MGMLADIRMLRRWSWTTLLAMALLVGVSALFIYSACHARTEPSVRLLYQKQLMWGAAGLGAYVVCALIDYRRLREGIWLYYWTCLALLVLVLLIGTRIYGGRRWLMFLGFGLQPSEFAKLAVVLALAHYLSLPTTDLRSPRTLLACLALAGVPLVLILKEPDLGTSIICMPIALAMMFVAGVPVRYLATLVVIGALAVGYVLGVLLVPKKMGMDEEAQVRLFTRMTGLGEYQRKRLEVFFDPEMDPKGAGWNRRQSEIAVGSGGWKGKGYLQGTQSMLGYLPRTVAPTDFIFSVIAEERGFVGACGVLGLFGVILGCGTYAGLRARDRLGRLICMGVMAMLFSHVFINVAMTIGLMPVTGLPLPLVSYGGSFMLSSMAALGLVQSVYMRRLTQA